jgi:hypothetical protein
MQLKCKSCGSTKLSWFPSTRNTSVVQDGRLRMHDVTCDFVLGCDECSDTVTVLNADLIAVMINSVVQQVDEVARLKDSVATQAGKVHQRNELIRDLLKLIDSADVDVHNCRVVYGDAHLGGPITEEQATQIINHARKLLEG